MPYNEIAALEEANKLETYLLSNLSNPDRNEENYKNALENLIKAASTSWILHSYQHAKGATKANLLLLKILYSGGKLPLEENELEKAKDTTLRIVEGISNRHLTGGIGYLKETDLSAATLALANLDTKTFFKINAHSLINRLKEIWKREKSFDAGLALCNVYFKETGYLPFLPEMLQQLCQSYPEKKEDKRVLSVAKKLLEVVSLRNKQYREQFMAIAKVLFESQDLEGKKIALQIYETVAKLGDRVAALKVAEIYREKKDLEKYNLIMVDVNLRDKEFDQAANFLQQGLQREEAKAAWLASIDDPDIAYEHKKARLDVFKQVVKDKPAEIKAKEDNLKVYFVIQKLARDNNKNLKREGILHLMTAGVEMKNLNDAAIQLLKNEMQAWLDQFGSAKEMAKMSPQERENIFLRMQYLAIAEHKMMAEEELAPIPILFVKDMLLDKWSKENDIYAQLLKYEMVKSEIAGQLEDMTPKQQATLSETAFRIANLSKKEKSELKKLGFDVDAIRDEIRSEVKIIQQREKILDEINKVKEASFITRDMTRLKVYASEGDLLALNYLAEYAGVNKPTGIALYLKVALLTKDAKLASDRFQIPENEILNMHYKAQEALRECSRGSKHIAKDLAIWGLRFLVDRSAKPDVTSDGHILGELENQDSLKRIFVESLKPIYPIHLPKAKIAPSTAPRRHS